MLGAYNSGALCLGLNSDSVAQLNSGYLSLLAESIKNLTFEGETSYAGITTRPGVPPKITVGDSPNLLTIVLERFAIDFYVWSHDKYARVFTYTADVTVPLDLQTGKSDKNPNGGLLPVLGNIGIANASVSNTQLVFEDDSKIKDGISGLVGGLVGQFLGGGFSPIDIASALASAGLAMEIPEGGIRKITQGSDDFLAIFANLKVAPPAAHEEVDTRAALVEKIVDPTVMSLDTAVRARFPKLRVRVDSVASSDRPIEHTWWIDDGAHSRWTTARDVVVDHDGMILQGKHVLHVASRIVGDVTSEDSTPVAIPYVIDTLPPTIRVDGSGSTFRVEAFDFVSPREALLMRERSANTGEWSEWSALHDATSATSDIEVKDEEGNVGKVSLALRGRLDPSIAGSGSGCGCTTTNSSSDLGSLALGGLAALFFFGTRTRRRSSNDR
jgi:MYXO-CTERM domain-containing protein